LNAWILDAASRDRHLFPAGQVKIVVHDDFRRDNLATYVEVATFLGVDAAFRPEPREINTNGHVRFALLSTMLARCGSLGIKNVVPDAARWRITRMLRAANQIAATRAPLDPGLRRELMARFRPEVDDLSRVLQRDLVRLWGYD